MRRLIPILLFASACAAQSPSIPLDEWKNVLLSGNSSALRALYSSNPPTRIATPAGEATVDDDLAFWTKLKVKQVDLNILQSSTPQPNSELVVFSAKLVSVANGSDQLLYLNAGQFWQKQSDGWRLIALKRTDPSRLEMPTSTSKDLYPASANARTEITEALARAGKEHKRVLLVFGANWCYDCHVLDLAFHRSDLVPVLEKNYEVVHVDVGQGDKNQDLMKQYSVPMEKGIPAIAVLEADGKLLFSQKGGEFEHARGLDPETLLAFLNKWKPS